MISLIPALALALAFVSFISSAFVLLYIIIPILPPHPLSRRVAPAEFGLPNFGSLSPADKCLIWLASLDLLAVAIFVWQTIYETVGRPTGSGNAKDPASSVRMWFVMTTRQTCLLVIVSVTLINLRMRRPTSFGDRQWMVWAPTLLLASISTTLAGVISSAGVKSLFAGLIAYSSTIAALSSVAFGCLIGTLVAIKRNLAAPSEDLEPWPPVRMILEVKPDPSFATEQIDVIHDGASWITSNASRRNSMSAWSFSTHDTTASSHHGPGFGCPQAGSHPSFPANSSLSFGFPDPNVPPVPPLPSSYAPSTPADETLSQSRSFRRDFPTSPRRRFGSQTSWLTSTNGLNPTLSACSYPTTHHERSAQDSNTPDLHSGVTRPITPALANAQVLGGYGYAPGSFEAEKGLAALATPSRTQINISFLHLCTWLAIIWVPLGLSLPYLIMSLLNTPVTTIGSVLLILSVTLSSPLLALSVLFAPSPIPSGLFENCVDLPNVHQGQQSHA